MCQTAPCVSETPVAATAAVGLRRLSMATSASVTRASLAHTANSSERSVSLVCSLVSSWPYVYVVLL